MRHRAPERRLQSLQHGLRILVRAHVPGASLAVERERFRGPTLRHLQSDEPESFTHPLTHQNTIDHSGASGACKHDGV